MKTSIAREIVSRSVAYRNCEKSGNEEWYNNHYQALQWLQDNHLPSGSGIDSGCQIDTDKTNADRIVINSSFHVMDEYGGYNGWINFTVTVKASLLFGFDTNIKGNFSSNKSAYGLKDYLYEIFDCDLRHEIDTDDMKHLFE